jgi:heme/copper-type cytochrome/quinol oxidase subunit 2
MKNMKQSKPANLKDNIFKTIEEKDVCPRSRWFFVCKETLVWVAWVVSVVVGAIAIAVTLFVVARSQYALYEAAYDTFFSFFVTAIPYLWLIVFALMSWLAVTNLRHTKHGYRYRPSVVIVSSLVVSLAGGAVLQLLGFGYHLDLKLGQEMKMYMSQDKKEQQLWQAPNDGRLIGRQVHTTTVPTTTVVFEDSKGQRWRLDVSELSAMDVALLNSNTIVRLVGTSSDLTTKQFHACGAFPWLLDKPMKLAELSEERKAFVERVYKHKDMAEERLAALEAEVFTADSERLNELMGPCAKIAPVRRIGANMQ